MDPATILLAEDDENDVLIMRRAFKNANIINPLSVVRDGEEAIQYLRGTGHYADRVKHPFPCLLLLDLKMPKKSGFDVLDIIKNDPQLNRLVTVVLTSSRQGVDINRAYDLWANSFLVKPASVGELVELLKSLHTYWLVWNERPDASVELKSATGPEGESEAGAEPGISPAI